MSKKVEPNFDELAFFNQGTGKLDTPVPYKKAPHRCPVCDGFGKVQYDPGNPFRTASTVFGHWDCHACLGTGVLWG